MCGIHINKCKAVSSICIVKCKNHRIFLNRKINGSNRDSYTYMNGVQVPRHKISERKIHLDFIFYSKIAFFLLLSLFTVNFIIINMYAFFSSVSLYMVGKKSFFYAKVKHKPYLFAPLDILFVLFSV